MESNYGKLIAPPIELQRKYFVDMCELRGVKVKYQYPLTDKEYNQYGEMVTSWSEPESVYCIFSQTIDQKTAKMMGWIAEEVKESMVTLPYGLHDLQVGCLIEIPSVFDNSLGRKFRITEISAVMIYPASVSCKIVPEFDDVSERSDVEDFKNTDFNLLYDGD